VGGVRMERVVEKKRRVQQQKKSRVLEGERLAGEKGD